MTTLTLPCPQCTTQNPSSAAFCSRCGLPLQLFNNRYRIIGEIAKGGVGIVYKVNDTACFDKIVAIKRFMPRSTSPDAQREAEEQCKHETQILSELNHYSIPNVHGYFHANNVWHMVMNFIEGETLDNRWQRAKRSSRLSIEDILYIGINLCTILHYLHQQSIVFIDLKPANVILENDKHIYLVDFGSAHRISTGRHRSVSHIITQGYAAPEIERGQPSLQSDIYSLGRTLEQLISDKSLSNISASERVNVNTRLFPLVPPKLWDAIKHMTQENVSDRPENVLVVQNELREIERQLTLLGNQAKKVDTRRRTFVTSALIVTAGVVLGTGIGVMGSVLTQKNGIAFDKKVIPFPLTVGGKLDDEAALLTEMYALLLQDAGFAVTDRPRLGKNDDVFNALTTGSIDIYPEFLLTGLTRLGIPSVHSQPLDFQHVRDGFLNMYQITWLDQAVLLDDNYAVTMRSATTTQLHIKSLSDLAIVLKQQQHPFKIAVAFDGESTLASLELAYGFTFAKENIITIDEKDTFNIVAQDEAQLNICIATDPLIQTQGFVRLIDDKKVLPVDTPSPIVRRDILLRAPQIATTLNKLAPLLSVEVSTTLQGQVVNGQNAKDVAYNWLKSKGLL